ncbi:MAG: molybdate ABC transporter substrate-binding protein, partial [Nocardioides sp.]|nr:molybdate ABC transporter substrate-binding protein [Nocardioides sp.]
DVFASADTKNMTKLGSDAVSPQNFASNILEIATPPGNPKHIKSFQDLAKPGTKVVVGAPAVPCGAATLQVEKKTGTTIKPVSQEQAVTDVLAKVTSGDADAGLVYVTDVKSAGSKVTGVNFPEASQVVNTYPIATLKDSKNTATAKQFVAFVRGAEGQKVLTAAGFGKP